MKLVCEGINLSEAVLKVVKACANKTTVPVMECIKLSARNDSLTLTATDGEISITKTIKAEIYEEGEICVPGRYFSDFIKKLEGEQITLSVDDKMMELTYADSQTAMQVLPADDFPKVDTQIDETSIVLATDELKKLITSTSFCCATDDARPILKGCQIVVECGEICVTALDGFRLATATGKVVSSSSEHIEFVCPARTLNEIEKMLPAGEGNTELKLSRGVILVCVEDTILTSRLYNGDFIKKENIMTQINNTDYHKIQGTRTQVNLARAFAGECQAYVRYEQMVSRAQADGLAELSNVFHELAKNESAHAKVWFATLTDNLTKKIDKLITEFNSMIQN